MVVGGQVRRSKQTDSANRVAAEVGFDFDFVKSV